MTALNRIMLGLTGLLAALPAQAQQTHRLTCQGMFQGAPATIVGQRQFVPTSAMGDGQVRFQGEIATAGMRGQIAYEGFTATAPFAGYVSGPPGTLRIGVLDNTAGRMVIYGGAASLGPPTVLGEFVCRWQ
ncbi:MAG TPA: hypothetical protein VJ890_21390 [Vineibacter sp.]|nr:hypothetical protein [Vineibacter sp.]